MYVEGNMSRGIQQVEYELGKYISLFFSKLASGQNPPKSCNLISSESGQYFLRSCPLTRAESMAASFTDLKSLFVVCE